jgi:hypothetical protein
MEFTPRLLMAFLIILVAQIIAKQGITIIATISGFGVQPSRNISIVIADT